MTTSPNHFDDVELLKCRGKSACAKAEAMRREMRPTQEDMNEMLGRIDGIEDISKLSDRQQIQAFPEKGHHLP
jgi:flavoprotein